MKKIYNYTFQLVCIYIFFLIIFSIFNFDLTKQNYNKKVNDINEEKVLDSTSLVQNIASEEKEAEKVVETTSTESKQEEPTAPVAQQEEVSVTPPASQQTTPNVTDLSSYTALASETVTISRYGPDCAGCGGQTSAGYYIGDGRIYYPDSTFGDLRIVAADKKYPLGTVMRITHNGSSFGVIVLDRGGGIGDHARFQLDLLERSEHEANSSYIMYNALLEVLRYGY